MKFPVNNCIACGLDLTTAEPVEIKSESGEKTGVAICPQCSAPYWVVGDTAIPLDAPAPVAETEPPRSRSGRRRAPEPEPSAEEPSAEEPPAEPDVVPPPEE